MCRCQRKLLTRGAVVLPGMPRVAVVIAVRGERRDPLLLDVGEVKAVHGWPPSGNLPSREKGSTFIIPDSPFVRNHLVAAVHPPLPPRQRWRLVLVVAAAVRDADVDGAARPQRAWKDVRLLRQSPDVGYIEFRNMKFKPLTDK